MIIGNCDFVYFLAFCLPLPVQVGDEDLLRDNAALRKEIAVLRRGLAVASASSPEGSEEDIFQEVLGNRQ